MGSLYRFSMPGRLSRAQTRRWAPRQQRQRNAADHQRGGDPGADADQGRACLLDRDADEGPYQHEQTRDIPPRDFGCGVFYWRQ